MQGLLCRYFFTQDRSIKHLLERWRERWRDTDDREVFANYVKQTAWQLNCNNAAVLNLIKACMSADLYDPLYPVEELDVTVAMLKYSYTKILQT